MMNARYYSIALCIWLIFITAVHADDEWNRISHEWDAAMDETMAGKAAPQRLEAAAQSLREWLKRQGVGYRWKNEQQREKFELIDYHLAEAWARAGDYDNALAHLEEEIRAQASVGGSLLHNTRNPDLFAMDVFKLHSAIMAHTGTAASIPDSGYEVFRIQGSDGKACYAFVFRPSDEDEGGVLVGDVAADEERRIIQLTTPAETGRYELADRAEVVAKNERFTVRAEGGAEMVLILGGVSKFVEYVGSGVPVVRPSPLETISLKLHDGRIEQPIQVLGLPSAVKEEGTATPVDRPKAGGDHGPNTSSPKATFSNHSAADRNGDSKVPRWFAIGGFCGAVILILGGVALWLRHCRRSA